MSECPYCENSFEMTETCSDEFRMWQGLQGPYYVPSVDENGILSWTNTGELPNPDPVSIMGPDGQPFYIAGTVATVADLPATGDGAWLVGSAAPYEAYTQINGVWTDIGVLTVGPAGQDGVGVPAGGSTNYVLAKRSNTDYDTEWQPAGGVAPYTSNPEMDGTASAGDSANFSRGNHVHPSDTSRLAIDGSSVTTWGTSQHDLDNLLSGVALCNLYVGHVPSADWWFVIAAGDNGGTNTQVAFSLWNNTKPVTRYCASGVWSSWEPLEGIKNKVLYFTSVACSATTGDFVSKSDAAITADHVVAECVFANPSAISKNMTWTTAAGSVKLNGTCTSATTVNLVLIKKDN